MTPELLKEKLEAGKTLLEIDQAEGTKRHASADDLATTLLAPVQTTLDAAVKNNQLTAILLAAVAIVMGREVEVSQGG